MCELCNLEKKTKWYYEDKEFIICDCLTCKVPMIVAKDHDEMKEAYGMIAEAYIKGIVKDVFRGRRFHFRTTQRKVKDHWHWHIVLENN